ncbi:MAG: GNAT family N-acetyltransferase [Planctomycetes bacterium]|nr:GNAT family N-acetyltransferase [Planctomycetota bacterium]
MRRAAIADLDAVLHAVQMLIDELRGTPSPLPEGARATCARWLESGEGGVVFAAGTAPFDGLLTLGFAEAIHAGGPVATIQELWVHQAARSSGVGAALVDAAAGGSAPTRRDAARSRSAEVLVPSLPRTLAFYSQCGFDLLGPRMRRCSGDRDPPAPAGRGPRNLRNRGGVTEPTHEADARLSAIEAGLCRVPGVELRGATVGDSELDRHLRATHRDPYLRELERRCAALDGEQQDFDHDLSCPGIELDTPLVRETVALAREGMRTALSAVAALADAPLRAAYALCRPPGHHAGPSWLGATASTTTLPRASRRCARGVPPRGSISTSTSTSATALRRFWPTTLRLDAVGALRHRAGVSVRA